MTAPRVLFDVPGPRAVRRARIGSTATTLVIAAVIALVIVQFDRHGEFAADKWRLFNLPSTWRFLGRGLLDTLKAAVVAGALAIPLAAVAAFGRISRNRAVRLVAGGYVELLRAIPVLLLLYVFLLLLPHYGVNVGPFWNLVLALALSNSAALAEILRSGILSMERGQSEAAYAIGLTYWQSMRYVIAPQALRRLAPALISQGIYLLKGTTLGYVVSYSELLYRGNILGNDHDITNGINGPLVQSYLVIMAVFVVVNASLAKLGRVVEGRQQRRYGRRIAVAAPE